MTTNQPSILRPSAPYTAPSAGAPSAATLLCLGAASVVPRSSGLAIDSTGPVAPLVNLGKPLAILAYLALSPNRTAPRERLADLLWGDQERAAARQSLRRALWYLRIHIGDWILEADDHTCGISASLACDAIDFVRLVESGQYVAALELYRGDFLADFASPGSREFESWAAIERAHLRSRAVRAAEAECRALLDQGRFVEARRFANRACEIDPQSELGWRLNLEALIAGGDRVGAMAEGVRFEAWLDSEGHEPEPASQAFIKMARQASGTATTDSSTAALPRPELVGREREFGAVLDAWRRACHGTVQMVTVTGAAGLGKSRLLDAVGQRLRSLRKRVLLVRAYAGERSIPNAFAGTLTYELAQLPGASGVNAAVVPHLVALDARLGEQFVSRKSSDIAASSTADRSTALRELIGAVCDDAPLALLLDDAHWFDDESRLLLVSALARLRASPLLVVIASRTAVAELEAEERATHLSVGRLSDAEVDALIASLGAFPAGTEWPSILVARIAAASRGIPLLVLGAIEELLAEGLLELTASNWQVRDEARLRDRLRHINALATRLRALAPAALQLLLMCSIAGRPLPRDVIDGLDAILGGADASQTLERAGYLRASPSGVEVSHDVIAETAIEIASDGARDTAVRELGFALSATTDSALVEHGIRQLATTKDLAIVVPPLTRLARMKLRDSRLSPREFVAKHAALPLNDALVRAAVRRLPFTLRFARWRLVAAISVVVTVAGLLSVLAVALRQTSASAPTLEIFVRTGTKTMRAAQVVLDSRSWNAAAPLAIRFGDSRQDTITGPPGGALLMPGENAWAVESQSPDSGGADVAIVTSDGRIRRLTWSHADETPESWSPDGRQLAVSTSAYSAMAYRTTGILDVTTRRMRPVGRRDLAVGDIAWSPDGTRLAYTMGPGSGATTLLCITPVDGDDGDCRDVPSPIYDLKGWLSDENLLIQIGLPGALYEYNVASGHTLPIGIDGVAESNLSPDGAWIAFAKVLPRAREIYLAPIDRPGSARLVTAQEPMPATVEMAWHGRFAMREYLDSVSIGAASDSVALGSTFQLSARGISSAGRTMNVHGQRWTTLNPDVASVDSVGKVTPIQPGVVTIELSAGGWRRARRSFVVARERASMILSETWNDPFSERWIPFGIPLPRIVTDSLLGNAFLNNGDGWYFSGAYLSKALDARHGLAVDAVLRTWPTRPVEQYLDIEIAPVRGFEKIRQSWDHRTGYPPARVFNGAACDFGYPNGEGIGNALSARPFGVLRRDRALGLPPIAKGVPVKLRLQLFPDGICGVALEGERPMLSQAAYTGTDSVTVLIQGNSVATKLLVGPLTIRRGVPGGVDWSRAARYPSP